MTRETGITEPRIWLDVTTSSNWSRPPVGIVRVEQQLSSELAKLYKGQFCECIVKDGAYVSRRPSGTTLKESSIFWPDSSRRSARSDTLEFVSNGKNMQAISVDGRSRDGIRGLTSFGLPTVSYGDIVISVGLDWENARADFFLEMKKKLGIRYVTCCYDLIPVIFPQYCVGEVAAQFKEYFAKLSWSSDLMLCISKRSQEDYHALSAQLGFPPTATKVIELGDGIESDLEIFDVDISDDVARVLDNPFILFVSTIERRKNHETLYKAYHLLATQGKLDLVPNLVFVGMPGWGVSDLLKDIELDPLTRGKIIQFNHVSDVELTMLYKEAEFCVYPSFYEGWGLPVAEGLSLGKVVIASSQGSIPEVGGDLVIYADPFNPHEWADRILELSTNPEALEAARNRVQTLYAKRKWSSTALAVKEAIDLSIIGQPAHPILLYPGYDMYCKVGIQRSGAVFSSGEQGPLIYGPYRTLPRGIYDIEISYDKLAGSMGKCDVLVASDSGRVQHAASNMLFDEAPAIGACYKLEKVVIEEDLEDFEVAMFIDQGLMICVREIKIQQYLQVSEET